MEYKDYYEQIAKEHGFQCDYNRTEARAFGSDNGNMVRVEYCLLKKEDYTYCAYDMFSPMAFMNNTHSGVYSKFEGEDSEFECTILKKVNPLLKFILSGRTSKIGNQFIDKSVDIDTNNPKLIVKYISEKTVSEYLALWETISPVTIVIGKGCDLLPNVPFYGEEQIIGIKTNKWIEPNHLLALTEQFKKLLDIVKNR